MLIDVDSIIPYTPYTIGVLFIVLFIVSDHGWWLLPSAYERPQNMVENM
jgi:hypothetical protein